MLALEGIRREVDPRGRGPREQGFPAGLRSPYAEFGQGPHDPPQRALVPAQSAGHHGRHTVPGVQDLLHTAGDDRVRTDLHEEAVALVEQRIGRLLNRTVCRRLRYQ